jgi:hypothetical protein
LSARARALAVAVLIALFTASARAHDIPIDVLVQTFFKPEGRTLHLLVRVPLGSMRDVNFPIHGAGFLDFPVSDQLLRDAAKLWIAQSIDIQEDGATLAPPRIVATTISLPSDRAFASYETARARFDAGPLPPSTELIWNQALFDVAFDYTIRSDRSHFAIRPALARLGVRVVTTLRFLPPDLPERAFEYPGDPGWIRLDPHWYQAAGQFVRLGFEHILSGTDHLLFLVCLVLPFRKLRQLVWIVTAFTVAHSITLIASALNLGPASLWWPPLIETLIAVSILYMALENIVFSSAPARAQATSSLFSSDGAPPPSARPDASVARKLAPSRYQPPLTRRLVLTFAFGLVHGFAFSFALKQTLQFAGSHLLTSLFSFNLGVELGQLLVLIVLVPVLSWAFRAVVAERVGVIICSALVAHTAWHWAGERLEKLRQFSWPEFDPALLAGLMRWGIVLVAIAAAIWLARLFRARNHATIPEDLP